MRRLIVLTLLIVFCTATVVQAQVVQAQRHQEHKITRITHQIQTLKAERHWAHTSIRWLKVIQPYVYWLRSTGDCENGSYGGPGLKSGLRAYNPSPFFGRYQFTLQTWYGVGGVGDPRDAGWIEQAYRAIKVRWSQGIGAWPVCGH